MTKQIEALRQWVAESESIVFFGGAGVSTESGIPDFRSVDGLYHQKFQYPPETILSHSFYVRRKAEFYDFYRAKMLAPWAEPNAAHRKLAQWEQEGRLKAVITQNIDGLHQKAGSREVLELHGSVLRNYCERCGAFYGLDTILHSTGVPRCPACGGDIKPDVVLYEESLDQEVLAPGGGEQGPGRQQRRRGPDHRRSHRPGLFPAMIPRLPRRRNAAGAGFSEKTEIPQIPP